MARRSPTQLTHSSLSSPPQRHRGGVPYKSEGRKEFRRVLPGQNKNKSDKRLAPREDPATAHPRAPPIHLASPTQIPSRARRPPMATAATASHPASASTSGRDALAAASSSPAAVCLVPFRYLPFPLPVARSLSGSCRV